MLKWCAYCQEFQCEVPPFEDCNHTHGICQSCRLKGAQSDLGAIEHAHLLRAILDLLMAAGRSNDVLAADGIVMTALKAQMRPVDILLGLVTPSLYSIGEQWKRGAISVADEHRHTSFCEEVFRVVRDNMAATRPSNSSGRPIDILLMTAPGNVHTLGIQMLTLWLSSIGRRSLVLDPASTLQDLMTVIQDARPRFLLISVALAEQWTSVIQIAEAISKITFGVKPQIFVGGYAVKFELVQPHPQLTLLSDITRLVSITRDEDFETPHN
jgi:methanogenic corrinoid protein MtbC1